MVKVSVLMACYNSERWVAQAIMSVLSQSYKNFEFVIVDDGSTDGTRAILKRFARVDKRIRIIISAHSGLTRALNKGLEICVGTWISRIDADDLWSVDKLKLQLQLVEKLDNVILIGSWCSIIDEEGGEQKVVRYPLQSKRLKKNLICAKRFFPHSSAMFKRRVGNVSVYYDQQYIKSQDYELWLRLLSLGEFACVNKSLVGLRVHRDQVSYSPNGVKQYAYMVCARTALELQKYSGTRGSCEVVGDSDVFVKWVLRQFQDDPQSVKFDSIKGAEIRKSLTGNVFIGRIRFVLDLVRRRALLYYLMNRWCGNRLPKKYAKRWRGMRCAA